MYLINHDEYTIFCYSHLSLSGSGFLPVRLLAAPFMNISKIVALLSYLFARQAID